MALACAASAVAEPTPAPAPPPASFRPVGPLIPLAPKGAFWPSVAYGSGADRYLALWVDVADPSKSWQLKGRLVDADTGAPAGPEFHLSPDPAAHAAVIGAAVYNSARREWFVVYQGCPKGDVDNVLGQRLADDGKKRGDPLPLVVKPGHQNQADVAYDAKDDRYLVTWVEKAGRERQVFARLFDGAGAPAGPETLLSEAPERMKHGPTAAYNPVAREFFVAWLDYRNWPGQGQDNDYGDVYGQRIDPATGAKIGGNVAVCPPRGARYKPDGQDAPCGVACNTKDGRYAVAFTRLMPKGAAVQGYVTKGTLLNADGSPCAEPFDVSAPAFGYATGVAYDPVGNDYLMTYEDAAQNISGVRISASGKPLGPADVVLSMPGGIRGGALAIRPRDGQYLQLAAADSGACNAQRFRATAPSKERGDAEK